MSSIGFLLKGPSFETQSRKDRRNNTRKAGSYNDLLHYYVSSFAFFSLIIPFFFGKTKFPETHSTFRVVIRRGIAHSRQFKTINMTLIESGNYVTRSREGKK